MFYKDWKPIYNKIAKDLNISKNADEKAANILKNILRNNRQNSNDKLNSIIKGKEVVIFGAGPSLESSLISNKNNLSNKIKISADGATSALTQNDILPDIIVTDLDGKISDQINANSKGSITVIHAHGDNIDKIIEYVPKFKGEVIGTTQINPGPYENINNFGGFTDGDRAIFLADNFKAKMIYLIGFDFDGKIGRYSFSENKDRNLKLTKLKWCKYLIDLLKKGNPNIQEL
ncbi:hypothetical protein AYK20_07430 [Thermoplasmatales archaeon SG8-52-1]|nr:MAG: hypothetical protein AYK20_07430 [Thermoplasmatales archaeon SG8-52-1]